MRIAGWVAELAVAAALVAVPAGRADASPQIDKADQLFAEGKALLASNLLQACDKFTESLRYNPAAIGTLLNVALCDEKLGRIASAVGKFAEARDRAKEQGLAEHQRAAEEHIAALTPSVPHLAITLAEPLPGTTVVVDDRVIPAASLADITVDPGERVIVVSAPARLPYRARLVIDRAEHKTVVVPALARSVTVTSSRRLIGQITTAAGGGAVGASIGLAFYARHLHRQQFDEGECLRHDGIESCSPKGQTATNRARTLGNVATVVGAVGIAAAAVGGYLWFTAPRSTVDRKVAVVPELTGDAALVVALGRF